MKCWMAWMTAVATSAAGAVLAAAPLVLATAAITPKADAQMQAVLEAQAALDPKPIEKLPPAEARLQASVADGVNELLQQRGNAAPQKLPAVGKVEMQTVPGPDGAIIPVRVYTPMGNGPFPVVLYIHGGGWVIATLDTYDASCRALCQKAGAVVVSVDYRRAPEHKFPTAHEDCYAALQYVIDHAADFNGVATRVAVAGESAGGNMATAACLMAAERRGKMPVHQVLIYPVANYAFDTPSYHANANAKPLNAAMMQWFFGHYLNGPQDGANKLVSPLRADPADLRELPPATVVTAEVDPLMSEGKAYAEKLRAAGVQVSYRNFEGVAHEFFGTAAVVDKAKDAQAFVAADLKAAFTKAH